MSPRKSNPLFDGARTHGGGAAPWRDGTVVTEQHAGLSHTPQESAFAFPLAGARWKKKGEMFWR